MCRLNQHKKGIWAGVFFVLALTIILVIILNSSGPSTPLTTPAAKTLMNRKIALERKEKEEFELRQREIEERQRDFSAWIYRETLEAAEKGNTDAQFKVGEMLQKGYGVKSDAVEAVKWYRRSAVGGNADGQLCLGIMYDMGEGVAQDFTEAAKLYLKSAEQGNHVGQFYLGLFFLEGKGVAKNEVEGLAYLSLAADFLAPAREHLSKLNGVIASEVRERAKERAKEIQTKIETKKLGK